MTKEELEHVLNETVIEIKSIAGGDIAFAQKVKTLSHTLFVKSGRFPNAQTLFKCEVEGLKAIKKTGAIDVPKIRGTYSIDSTSCLIMEFVASKSPDQNDYRQFGQKLAQLHSVQISEIFGFEKNNFIGKLPQNNAHQEDWATFYITNRLQPQLKMALENGMMQTAQIPSQEKMMTTCKELIGEVVPSLLHGDLWSGNYVIAADGTPFLIDPSVYYGHNEVDLAMTRLFGGFSSDFYAAYHEIIPPHENQAPLMDIYQLYYVLVHLNLFGSSYIGTVLRILKKYFY
ncbi:MAG: fructosamine kinase family protein [Croceivirga sp.]